MRNRAFPGGVLAALVVLILAIAIAIPRDAAAALIPIASLESLAFEATAVVYATRLSSVDAGEYAVATTYRVEKAYRGELRVGDTFTVDDWEYPATDPFDRAPVADEGKRVFFLEHRGEEGKTWSIVSTGARLVSAGRVYRFYQYMNPGGLAPTPERDGRDRGPITFAAFERKLDGALRRAERAHAVLAGSRDRATFRRACLQLLGPPVLQRDASSDGEDLVANQMIRALADAKDVEGVIEVLARTDQDRLSAFPLVSVNDALPRTLAMAKDPARPIPVRVAALEALRSFTTFDDRYDVAVLVPLVADRSPDVRIAAVHAIAAPAGLTPARKGQPQKSRTIVLEDWKKERDPWVRLALANTLEWLAKPDPVLPPRDPLLAARADRDGRLELEYYATLDARAPGIGPPEVRYVATDAGGVTREGNLGRDGFSYGMSSGAARRDLPLEPGMYKLAVTAKFDFEGVIVERTVQVDDFTVPPPSSVDARAREPAEEPVDVSAGASARGASAADAVAARPARGCGGCTAADPETALSVFLVPVLALAFLIRRGSKSARSKSP
jgi:hypothetical protein